jgi:hypothetical protein
MFNKKLLTGVTILMVVALATIGVAYAAWSDTLFVNGNATTGTFDVHFDYYYTEAAVVGCDAALSADKKTVTVTIANAYPGFTCAGGYSLVNGGTIPARINGLVQVNNTVPANFTVTPPGLVYMTDAIGNNVPSGGSFMLAAGATGGGVMWNFAMPAGETGHEGETYTFSYTFLAQQ